MLFNLLFCTWFFWLIVGVCVLSTVATLNSSLEKRWPEFNGWPIFWLSIVVLGTLWRYGALRDYLTENSTNWITPVVLYVIAGVVFTIIKWCVEVSKLKSNDELFSDIAEGIAFAKRVGEDTVNFTHIELEHKITVTPAKDDPFNVKVTLDHERFPIMSWLLYWPFVMLTSVVDGVQFIYRIIRKALSGVFTTIANVGSVKVSSEQRRPTDQ